jgi:hypothetical protein
MDSTSPRRSQFAVLGSRLGLAACLAAAGLAVGSPAPAQALPVVERQGADLTIGGERFRVWGFNYGVGDRYAILSYFDAPTKPRLRQIVADMREARSLGANTLRVYLELKAFMKGPREPNARALDALARLLKRANLLHLYLDLTGNLVWRSPPAWYDNLPEQVRWAVQARFWRAVARTAAESPAVLVYELTSEPVIEPSDRWYGGEFGGYTFVQRIVRDTAGRDASQLARRWIRRLGASIRKHDQRHLIGLGLLPQSAGPFGPANVADMLDVLLVHEYPEEGRANEAISVVRQFAAQHKPVILGETAPLFATLSTWESFLRGSRRHVDGYLSFYDGRTPAEAAAGPAGSWYAAMLEQFVALRVTLA